MSTIKGICGKLNEEAANLKVDIGLEKVIRMICEFVDVGSSMFEDLVSVCKVEVPVADPVANNGNSANMPVPVINIANSESDTVFTGPSQNTYSLAAAKPPTRPQPVKKTAVAQPPKDPKLQAFQDTVKHSEKCTLVFNLDLGRHKTLNEQSILAKATLALSEAAATVEGNKGKPPSRDAVSALDDIMSVTENVTLFGKVTKPYVNNANPADPRNRTFFTLPVRYEFRDRDTKIEAETILRDTCKVDCTTPYPTILRHYIKQVIDHMKVQYPEQFIKVTVDTANLLLRVTRRHKTKGWYSLDEPIKLPEEVLDIHARKVPDGLPALILPVRKESSSETPPAPDDRNRSEEEEMPEV
jgi:hypothetical protein